MSYDYDHKFQGTLISIFLHFEVCFYVPNTFQTSFLNVLNPFTANFIKWSNTLEQFVGNLPTDCLSVFNHFVGLALKGLSFTVTTSHIL